MIALTIAYYKINDERDHVNVINQNFTFLSRCLLFLSRKIQSDHKYP